MAPTTTAGTAGGPATAQPPQTLQQRLQGVVQHQQFFWWVGHVIIVLATVFHALYWFRFNWATRMAVFWYRLAFMGSIGSYGVVVHKMFFRVLFPSLLSVYSSLPFYSLCICVRFFLVGFVWMELMVGWIERSTATRRIILPPLPRRKRRILWYSPHPLLPLRM